MNYWKGKSVVLRAPISTDISLFESFDDEISRNVDTIHYPQSKEGLSSWFENEVQELKRPKDDRFRWIAEDMDGNLVGTIDTFSCYRRNGTFKYGIALSREFWGKGYGGEMILLVLRYYFLELGYQKATPHVYAFNDRSIKLHEKLGFVREGRLRSMIYSGGQYHDSIYFGMTKQEFTDLYKDYSS